MEKECFIINLQMRKIRKESIYSVSLYRCLLIMIIVRMCTKSHHILTYINSRKIFKVTAAITREIVTAVVDSASFFCTYQLKEQKSL